MVVAGRQGCARQRAQHEQLALEAEQTIVEPGEDGVEVGHFRGSSLWIRPDLAAIGERSANGIGAIGLIVRMSRCRRCDRS
ncbi:hypothetical protein BRDID11002_44310 [Bradyrhizobium diazoefficiens]|uniref:Uncharacterized protein n=1 Tax=Bradyrhizobium diazoefficiens TaxID=1355477 RepID=A0A809ZH94_9BRAD|nr:hypothetical protein XF1B_52070 [Bradyrhizobium diazoefficiens]BCE48791.1 hypothetical protein XF4B_51400 [Bradyrhizobium diazoefficiens]BCE92304.1 hypothetical protein XF10B_51020 [Bradyrhizobium diazoefficiens]BCF27233.1 hypothetical protein XF14B_51850 [Bradyrhizobium diazoefficiens]